MVLSLILSFVEELSLLIFPLALFGYSIKNRLGAIALISIAAAALSHVVREYIDISYSVFIIMILFYLLLYSYLRDFTASMVILTIGYVTNTTLMAVVFGTILLVSGQPLPTLTNHVVVQIGVFIFTSITMFGLGWLVIRKKWQINLPSKTTPLGRQTNLLLSVFSLVGLIMCCQTVTAFFLPYHASYLNSLMIFGISGLFIIFVLILRNIKVMQKQAKLEEDMIYLENMESHSKELIDITQDFYSQMEVIHQLLRFQDKKMILFYLEQLLSERKFIHTSIEIDEPLLRAFLQKERHICQSFGIAMLIKCEGYYAKPARVSGYQLNRILGQLIRSLITALREEEQGGKNLLISIRATSEEITFEVSCSTICDPDISNLVSLYKGRVHIEKSNGSKVYTQTTITFPRY